MTSGKIRLSAGVTETPQYARRAVLALMRSKGKSDQYLAPSGALPEIAEPKVQAEPNDIEAIVAGKGGDGAAAIGRRQSPVL
jgi:anthranilate phosphoribosyltransferase